MGLFKKIIVAVSDKAKDELKEYVKRVLEEKEQVDNSKEVEEKAPSQPAKKEEVVVEQKQVVKEAKPTEQDEAQNSISQMIPLVNELPQKYTFTTSTVPLTRDIIDLTQLLSFDEFAIYLKLYIYSVAQRKNYGYLGNSLRRKTGLDTMDHRLFELTLLKLSAHGLISIEDLSSNQRTFILYVPFDEEFMKSQKKKEPAAPRKEEKRHSNNNRNNRDRNNSNRNNSSRQTTNRQRSPREKEEKKENPQKQPAKKQSTQKSNKPEKQTRNEPKQQKKQQSIPGRPTGAMSNDELRKQYITFVSLEIDKAKMRVGRSSFDKIYMEAVKYIDSKYGFKVLSDPDKFKEYLTNYYMSAFDIPEFEEWKQNKK